jgi:hypothetical protein
MVRSRSSVSSPFQRCWFATPSKAVAIGSCCCSLFRALLGPPTAFFKALGRLVWSRRHRRPSPFDAGSGGPVPFCERTLYSARTPCACRCPPHACRRICTDEVQNIPAISDATTKTSHAVAVLHTPSAATITTTLPMASLRERSQTGAHIGVAVLVAHEPQHACQVRARASTRCCPSIPLSAGRG